MRAAEWNDRHPIGTRVRYRPVINRPEFTDTCTRSEAWTVGRYSVVLLKGEKGGKLLSHLEVLTDD